MTTSISTNTTVATIARFDALEADVETFRASVTQLGRNTHGLRRSLDHLSATLARAPRQTIWSRWRQRK